MYELRRSALALLTGIATCGGLLTAQTDQIAEALVDSVSIEAAPDFTPLTLQQNYLYSLGEIFGPQSVLMVAGQAGMDQIGKHADGWGSTAPAYGIRVASWLGHSLIRENLAFGVRALDGEDPHYFRSGKGTAFRRARYAITHTFEARGRNGEFMPAYSVLADYATPFITQAWRHGGMMGGRELRRGTLAIGSEAAINIGREFWPDLKKKLHR